MSISLEKILSDNQSGSEIITRNTLLFFKETLVAARSSARKADEAGEAVFDGAKSLIKHFPNMVLLRRQCAAVTGLYKRLLKSARDEDVLEAVINRIDSLLEEMEENTRKIAAMGSKIIASYNKVMTISKSTLVSEIFITIAAQRRRFDVFNLISHPPDEGVGFAEFLANHDIRATLIADAQMGVFLPKMNLVLIGADRLYKDGFINKAGTLPLCLAAKHHNIPVYLAVETGKILFESERAIKFSSQDPLEVYRSSAKKLNVENVYYEKTPLDLVHKIICENGVFETFEFKEWYLKE